MPADRRAPGGLILVLAFARVCRGCRLVFTAVAGRGGGAKVVEVAHYGGVVRLGCGFSAASGGPWSLGLCVCVCAVFAVWLSLPFVFLSGFRLSRSWSLPPLSGVSPFASFLMRFIAFSRLVAIVSSICMCVRVCVCVCVCARANLFP